jgi:fructose-specific component phosphotransferase system IIB-like protein
MQQPEERVMTPAIAEAVGALFAELMQVMLDARTNHPELEWTEMVSAAAITMRAVVGMACRRNPALAAKDAERRMIIEFSRVLAAPPELIKFVDDGNDDRAGFIPVRRQ